MCDAGIGGGNSGGAGGRVGNITITGGCVKANGCIGATEGTCDGIMLGWSRAGDRIEAGSFNAGNVSVVDGRPLTDGENVYEGALEAAQLSSLSGKTLRPYIPSYAAWAAASGISGAWNETDALGIHNVFRYAFDKPTGAFANPPLLDIKIEGGNAVVKTPPVAITAGFTVAVVESSDVAGATVTATKPLNATGRAKFPMGSAASRFYRLSVTEGDPELGGVQLWEGGPYWAECNVGATEPEEYGYYFWWGDTVGYERQGNAWVAADGSSSDFSFSPGNTPTYDKDNHADKCRDRRASQQLHDHMDHPQRRQWAACHGQGRIRGQEHLPSCGRLRLRLGPQLSRLVRPLLVLFAEFGQFEPRVVPQFQFGLLRLAQLRPQLR